MMKRILTKRGRRFAILICNNAYIDKRLSNFSNAEEFMQLDELLKNPRIGSFYTRLLINESLDFIKQEIETTIGHTDPDDTLLIYFNGHGLLDKYGGYYYAVNSTDIDRLDTSAISASFVKKLLFKSKAKKQAIILDSCFSGAFAKEFISKSSKDLTNEDFGEFLQRGKGKVVLSSSSSLDKSFLSDNDVVGQFSVFTKYLIEGLSSGNADIARDGFISIHDAYYYVLRMCGSNQERQTPHITSLNQDRPIILGFNTVMSTPDEPLEDLSDAIDGSLGHKRFLEGISLLGVGLLYFIAFTSVAFVSYWLLIQSIILSILLSGVLCFIYYYLIHRRIE